MDSRISLGGEIKEVEIESVSDPNVEQYSIILHGGKINKKKIVILKRDKNRLILDVQGKIYSIIQTQWSSTSVSFLANGKTVHADLGDAKKDRQDSSSLIATANELVASNFPAKIVKLLVKKGDSPKEGDTLIVLEAMKMEAQIKAPQDCRVEEVFVKEGDMVERGKGMIRLKFE